MHEVGRGKKKGKNNRSTADDVVLLEDKFKRKKRRRTRKEDVFIYVSNFIRNSLTERFCLLICLADSFLIAEITLI